jgi:hypothetical protein
MSNNTQTVYNIYYEPETGFVIMQWRGYATSAQFREGTEIMLNTLIANKANKVLADIQDMLVIGMADQEWLQKQFIPRAINFGFKALAMVKPKSYFNKVAVEAVSYKVDKAKLTINFFDGIEEAREWLVQF